MFKHIPILSSEVLKNFKGLEKKGTIVDGTLGKGGHSKLLLENGFEVIGIDRDKEAIEEAKRNLGDFDKLKIIQGNFSHIKEILSKQDLKKVAGILLDLGVSTHQLEKERRGFGFIGELDMRMDQNQKLTAKEVVNKYPEKELAEILFRNGERVNSRKIAREIVEYRKKSKIKTGEQLLKLVKYSLNEKYRKSRKHHWATPTFRALRIEVNKDYENLENFLEVFSDCLKPEGILQIITFHSLEESIVRKKLRELKQKKILKLITKRPTEATQREITKNPKSKRAKLWVAEMK
jgi:16S rRNA (cytosine1402-N4)-methyltransferase